MKGLVFDVQRFSVHDGPGIRTTVFMKGCPLRCRWCHNPEGLSGVLQLQFQKEKCIGCGRCGGRKLLSDADVCPAEALTVCGRTVEESELLEEVLKDFLFYGERGGVTFSGGECLLQAEFVAAVLWKIKERGLHTAVDTCGYVPWGSIEKTLSVCDLYLYDVKCITPSLHKEYTGVDNSLILENLRRLSLQGKEIWVRIPVIPGFNNNEYELTAIADFLSSLQGIAQVTLMPYHSLGASKYETLGLTYSFDSSLKISAQDLASYQHIFSARSIPIT